ncbi:MAG: hypothetical protein PWP23_3280 [Candidatus Sumerlaeota bacterium]|nr:hypothetical protein [Candidatus Sumerlaeota bacterium]
MARLTLTRSVAAPREEVFAVFTDLEGCTERIDSISKVELLTPGPFGAGTRWRETRVMYGKERAEILEVTEYDPPAGYTVACASCGSLYTTVFRFEEDGAATRVTMEFVSRPMTFMARVLSVMMAPMMGAMRKALESDLDALKHAAEKR